MGWAATRLCRATTCPIHQGKVWIVGGRLNATGDLCSPLHERGMGTQLVERAREDMDARKQDRSQTSSVLKLIRHGAHAVFRRRSLCRKSLVAVRARAR